jgi:60S ribosomal subunit assembly/export protein LOC1
LKKKRKRNSEPARTDDADTETPDKSNNKKKEGKAFKPRKRVSFG